MSDARQAEVIVVGAGIIGLAHALAAARAGARVTVIDRDSRANGASIRNFGFITVTGQERGPVWDRARRTAGIWRDVAPQAGIRIDQEGLLLLGQRPEAAPVLDAFMATEMAMGCTRLTTAAAKALCPQAEAGAGAILSRNDLRVESREALPRLTAWLAAAHGVRFRFGSAVVGVETGRVSLASGEVLAADAIFVCPGDDWATLFPAIYAEENITRCKLQMLRLAAPGWRLPVRPKNLPGIGLLCLGKLMLAGVYYYKREQGRIHEKTYCRPPAGAACRGFRLRLRFPQGPYARVFQRY